MEEEEEKIMEFRFFKYSKGIRMESDIFQKTDEGDMVLETWQLKKICQGLRESAEQLEMMGISRAELEEGR